MKKTIILSVLFLLFSFTLFAQQDKKRSPVLLGESLSANISLLKPFNSGYIAGINAIFWSDKKFSTEIGLEYSTLVYQAFHVDKEFTNFFGNYSNASALDIARSAHFISIPVKGMVNYGKGKVRFFSGLGISVDCAIKQSEDVKAYYGGYSQESSSSYYVKKNNLGFFTASAFTGIVYDLGANWQLRSTVSFRQFVPHPFLYGPTSTVGVGVGLFYKL